MAIEKEKERLLSDGELYFLIILFLVISLVVSVFIFFTLSTDNKLLEERINLLQNRVDALEAKR